MIKALVQAIIWQMNYVKWYIVLLSVLIFLGILWLSKRGHIKERRSAFGNVICKGCLAVSAACIFATTLFGRETDGTMNFELHLFWSYKKAFTEQDVSMGAQILNNILLYIPFGCTVPLNIIYMDKTKKVVLLSVVLSASIELFQGITGIGLCELDDIIGNTLGGLIGAIIYAKVEKHIVNHQIQ